MNLYLRDIIQTYVQSITSLIRDFFVCSFVELIKHFDIDTNSILKIIKSLYDVLEVNNHWFVIYHAHHVNKLEMTQLIYDLCLLYIDFKNDHHQSDIDNSGFERTSTDAANATSVLIVVSAHVSNYCFYCQTSALCNHIVWSVITLIIRFATENNHHVVRIRDDFYFDFKSSIIIIDNMLFIRSFVIIKRFDHVKSIASFWFVAFFEQKAWC